MTINESHMIFKFFKNILKRSPGVLIDVGSHVGNSLRPFALDKWQVHAFEPDSDNYKELVTNYTNYPNVVTNQKAVSNKTGKTKFYISNKYWGIHSLKPFDNTHKKSIKVDLVKLSKYEKQNNLDHIDFLKIDAEGADYLVLKGFDFSVDKPDIVMVEFMDSRTEKFFNYNHHDMAKLLKGVGYNIYVSRWSKIVGGYSTRKSSKSSTKFLSFERYPVKSKLHWGNLIAVRKKYSLLFMLFVKYYLFTIANPK